MKKKGKERKRKGKEKSKRSHKAGLSFSINKNKYARTKALIKTAQGQRKSGRIL